MKDNIPTLAFADIGAVVSRNLTRALKGEFELKDFSEQTQPDIIIFDLDVKDGLVELETLRKNEPGIPILVLGSVESPALLEQVLDLDNVDFLRKPIDTTELKLRAKKLIRTKKYSDESVSLPRGLFVPGLSIEFFRRIPKVPLSELHGESGRLDASAIARYLAIPLSRLAEAIGANYPALHKTPDAVTVQTALTVIKRILVILSEMLGKRETVLAWLNSPHPNLRDQSPLAVMLEGHGDAVLTILENARAGVPS